MAIETKDAAKVLKATVYSSVSYTGSKGKVF